jgi:hypothetical protein
MSRAVACDHHVQTVIGIGTDVAVVTFDNKNILPGKYTRASTLLRSRPVCRRDSFAHRGCRLAIWEPQRAETGGAEHLWCSGEARVQVVGTRQDGRILLRGPWGTPPAEDRIYARKGDSGGGAWFQVAPGNYSLVAVASSLDIYRRGCGALDPRQCRTAPSS